MQQFKDILQKVLDENASKIEQDRPRKDRTGVGRYSIFGQQLRFDLSYDAFPMVTIKKTSFKLIKSELKWFMRGDTNIKGLLVEGNHIWDEWAFERYICSDDYTGTLKKSDLNSADEQLQKQVKDEIKAFCERILSDEEFAEKHGDLGSVYGKQWRNIEGHNGLPIDQLAWVLEEIKRNPNSTRLIVDSWTVQDIYGFDEERNLPMVALPPCHMLFQFYVADNKLSCQLTMRSNDLVAGFSFNVAGYALITMVMAQLAGLEPGELVYNVADAHIYANHLEIVDVLLAREPMKAPRIKITANSLEDWDAELIDYNAHPTMKIPIAV